MWHPALVGRVVVQVFYLVAFCFGMLRFNLKDHLDKRGGRGRGRIDQQQV